MKLERLKGQALQNEINKLNEDIAVAQMQDKMINNYLSGNVVAQQQIEKVIEQLEPVHQFFTNTPEPAKTKKRISKKERERIAFEEHKKMLRLEAIASIQNGGY